MSLPLLPTTWSVLSAFSIFIFGLALTSALAHRLGHPVASGVGLYVWHTFFCIAYAWYVTNFGGDAVGYYRSGLQGHTPFGLGTAMVNLLTGAIIEVTRASFLGVSLVFNIAGAVGLVLLHDVLASVTNPERSSSARLVRLVVLMPSASFWTSGVGKDSLAFLAVTLMTWATIDMAHRRIALAPSIALMYLVRPHMAGLMLAMLLVAALGSPQGRLVSRILHGAVVAGVITVALPIMTAYVGLEDAQGLQDVSNYIEGRQGYNQQGDAGVDISQLPAPFQVATYLYRPLPHEAWSLFALMASAENLFLIVLTGMALYNRLHSGRSRLAGRSMFLWLYLLGGSYILATTTANLGIAVRQKWMLMPPLLALLFASIDRAGSPTRSAVPRRLTFASVEPRRGAPALALRDSHPPTAPRHRRAGRTI